jgi:hypothetical protein
MVNFEDVVTENIWEDIRIVKEDVILSLRQQLTELKEELKKTHVLSAVLNT